MSHAASLTCRQSHAPPGPIRPPMFDRVRRTSTARSCSVKKRLGEEGEEGRTKRRRDEARMVRQPAKRYWRFQAGYEPWAEPRPKLTRPLKLLQMPVALYHCDEVMCVSLRARRKGRSTHDAQPSRLLRPFVPHRREEDKARADGRLEDAEEDALDDESLIGRADDREADHDAPDQDQHAEGLDGVDALQQQCQRQDGHRIAPVETTARCRIPEGRDDLLAGRGVDVGCREVKVGDDAKDGGRVEYGLCKCVRV